MITATFQINATTAVPKRLATTPAGMSPEFDCASPEYSTTSIPRWFSVPRQSSHGDRSLVQPPGTGPENIALATGLGLTGQLHTCLHGPQ